MPNLILTYRCNNNCEFCFADSEYQKKEISLDELNQLLPFLHSFKRESIRLVGGEPTLNPDFIEIMNFLFQQGFKVNIFTNGKLQTHLIEKLKTIQEEFHFCVNRTNPILTSEIIQFYQKLGYRIQLSVTFFQTSQSVDHILDEILTYKLDRQYRLGIALPIFPGRQNQYLHPNDYLLASEKLFAFFKKGIQSDIRPSFDCGFPYCFFNEEQKRYFEENNIQFFSNCGIIPDITPDFFAIHCFPLAYFKQPVSDNMTWQILQQKFDTTLNACKYEPIFEKCKECKELHTKKCSGGCMSLRLKADQ